MYRPFLRFLNAGVMLLLVSAGESFAGLPSESCKQKTPSPGLPALGVLGLIDQSQRFEPEEIYDPYGISDIHFGADPIRVPVYSIQPLSNSRTGPDAGLLYEVSFLPCFLCERPFIGTGRLDPKTMQMTIDFHHEPKPKPCTWTFRGAPGAGEFICGQWSDSTDKQMLIRTVP